MSEIFDSAFFAKLSGLKLASHMRLDRGQSGSRKSSAKGSSAEFSDFREYLPGDDIRRIDWNAYGRLDRLYIKQFMEEKEAFYHILLDTSGSMDFGEQKKSVMALRLAAAFAWITLRQLDRVEVIACKDSRPAPLTPVAGRGGFSRLLSELENLSFSGKTGLSEAVRRVSPGGRGICILLSDFLDPEGIDGAVKYLTFKRQEVFLVQILAREELNFDAEGTVAITDMETGQEVRVSMTRQTVEEYQKTLERHNEGLQKRTKRYGCTWLQVASDQDIGQVIFETLHRSGIFS